VRPWLFPLGVACFYGLGQVFAPENTGRAVQACVSMFRQLALPVCLALVMMVVFNRFLSPATVTRFLGQRAGWKGVVFSSLGGILSMGPVYAWYPLFKTLREKGASVFHVANFIGCRSIKPVLLPVMVAYFGWGFTSAFVVMSLAGALITAGVVSVLCSFSYGGRGDHQSTK
jgi:uncharacterized membrane protein YraQ (UPF0718 family)